MAHRWFVQVFSDGSPVTGAAVWLMKESSFGSSFPPQAQVLEPGVPTTHVHQSGGLYGGQMPADPKGEWRLLVQSTDKSPVIQPIHIKPDPAGSGFVTEPRDLLDPARPSVEAATVEIKTVTLGTNVNTTFHVNLFPKSEVVLVSGTQYGAVGHGPLRAFAEGRRDALHRAKRIDDGTIATIVSLDDRRILHFFKGKGDSSVWTLGHFVEKRGTPPRPITPGSRWPFTPDKSQRHIAIHPFEVYKYLSDVGSFSTTRGRVREVSVLSHAFIDGPILYNTFDLPERRPNPIARDPNDYDCRTKDFDSPNMSGYPNLVDAMASGSRWHVWGCNFNGTLVRMTAAATQSRLQGMSDDAFFVVPERPTGHGTFETRTNRLAVLEHHVDLLAALTKPRRGFAGVASARLQKDVFAPLPGTWSSFDEKNGAMFVVTKAPHDLDVKIVRAYHLSEPILAPLLEFSAGIDGENYVNYAKYRGLKSPPVPPRSEQYEFKNFVDKPTKKDACSIEFHGGKGVAEFGHAKVVSTLVPDVGALDTTLAGKRGHVYVLRRTPDAESTGVLVVEDQGIRVFRLRRTGGSDFDRVERELS